MFVCSEESPQVTWGTIEPVPLRVSRQRIWLLVSLNGYEFYQTGWAPIITNDTGQAIVPNGCFSHSGQPVVIVACLSTKNLQDEIYIGFPVDLCESTYGICVRYNLLHIHLIVKVGYGLSRWSVLWSCSVDCLQISQHARMANGLATRTPLCGKVPYFRCGWLMPILLQARDPARLLHSLRYTYSFGLQLFSVSCFLLEGLVVNVCGCELFYSCDRYWLVRGRLPSNPWWPPIRTPACWNCCNT